MEKQNWRRSRFDGDEIVPVGPLTNLVDMMLVFACGLIAAIVASSGGVKQNLSSRNQQSGAPEQIEEQKQMKNLPKGIREKGKGYKPVGEVYRDPETGKMYLVEEPDNSGDESEQE